ncbi:Rhs element Vgr protein [Neorhizobium galegae bv. officinalis]|uniref:Rhs element Vgr protein n=1 Tax=Neorhizobium galegae bv. officinalis TaxID=323656 RepID=A0A0T7FI52_NEOGA|nr:type VI secretion system tip protein TssI/VgrG [Neorhizobium galegae]CDZ34649.1 Rhs element Vgr protein [Neorhizobium galegae bv. officinalis]
MDDVLVSSDFIQANRVLKITSPLGEDQLLPERVTVEEGVNRLFEITVVARAKREAVKPEELIGYLVNVDLEVREGRRRPFNGLVTKLMEGPPVTRGLRSYTLTIRPQMWLLSRRSDCRIWMNKSTLDVLEILFSEHGLPAPDIDGIANVPPQLYSVQWNETDLDYLLRRLEEDGLFYWFEHRDGSHRLKVADRSSGWSKPSEAAEGESRVRLAHGSSDRNHINEWTREFAYIPGRRSGADWNFETPNIVPGTVTHALVQMPGATARELYEYPARISDVQGAERAEKLRMQAAEADHERVTGKSNVRILEPGRRFTPYEVAHPDRVCEEHVIVSAVHTVVDRSYETNSNEPEYSNKFEAVPSRVPMTPHRNTKRPRIEGSQVAVVAGPTGEEIHTDKYGRIKVWFPWDRRAKKDGSDTCWCRVSQPWGGGTWGSQVIPRIGMEVMVSFVDGDPDRPLVTGVVPNPANPVPYELPANKTRMVLRSNTHKGQGFNEITFEDDAGKENQFFHAQKDQTTRVLNDRTKRVERHEVASIGGNRAVEVSGNQKHEVGGSMNTVVGGTGPMAMALMGAVQGLAGQTAELLAHAGNVGGAGPGLAPFATSLASSALGFLGVDGLTARQGVVAGSSPRADAGTALAGSGTGVGDAASGLFPLPGIMNTIVGSFKSDTIGVARAEQIGVSKVTNVGQTSMENVGKAKNTTVGEEYVIQVGDRMLVTVGREFKIVVGKSVLVMDKDGNVTILGTNFNFTASGPVTINGKVIDLNP